MPAMRRIPAMTQSASVPSVTFTRLENTKSLLGSIPSSLTQSLSLIQMGYLARRWRIQLVSSGQTSSEWVLPQTFSYSVDAGSANKPVNYVNFWDARRGSLIGLITVSPLDRRVPVRPRAASITISVTRHCSDATPAAKFFIPTENEWYKAAYHNQAAGLAASYFDYPTGTNAVPGHDITESTNPGNNANYFINGYAVRAPYRTVVGEFELSDSPYGTFDQGGNMGMG